MIPNLHSEYFSYFRYKCYNINICAHSCFSFLNYPMKILCAHQYTSIKSDVTRFRKIIRDVTNYITNIVYISDTFIKSIWSALDYWLTFIHYFILNIKYIFKVEIFILGYSIVWLSYLFKVKFRKYWYIVIKTKCLMSNLFKTVCLNQYNHPSNITTCRRCPGLTYEYHFVSSQIIMMCIKPLVV